MLVSLLQNLIRRCKVIIIVLVHLKKALKQALKQALNQALNQALKQGDLGHPQKVQYSPRKARSKIEKDLRGAGSRGLRTSPATYHLA